MDRNELLKQRVHCEIPGMENVRVVRDLIYLTVEDKELKLDIYQPADMAEGSPLPAVVFVHGEAPWELIQDVQNWGQYQSWGRLAAASGFIGIVICRRPTAGYTKLPEVANDVPSALAYVREHAREHGIDSDRIGLWACSAGGPAGLSPVLSDSPAYLRCIAGYYLVLDLRPHMEELLPYLTEDEINRFSPLYYLERNAKEIPPLLMVKAGQDSPFFNEPIEAFAANILPGNPHFTYLVHEEGHHGFDVNDNVPRTQEIVLETLAFLKKHLFA